MVKAIAYTIGGICLALIIAWVLFTVSKSRTFQFFGTLVSRVETEEQVVALTFDDGPTEYTDEVLDILDAKNVHATFYVVGQDVEKNPTILKRIVEAGHDVGNHSYSHQRFLLKSYSFIQHEVGATEKLIRDSGYDGLITFRQPYGKRLIALPWYLASRDIITVTWDIEPDTYVSGDAKAIVSHTLERARSGSIILLHPFCETVCKADRDALPILIDALAEKGYRFVTISELLKLQTNN